MMLMLSDAAASAYTQMCDISYCVCMNERRSRLQNMFGCVRACMCCMYVDMDGARGATATSRQCTQALLLLVLDIAAVADVVVVFIVSVLVSACVCGRERERISEQANRDQPSERERSKPSGLHAHTNKRVSERKRETEQPLCVCCAEMPHRSKSRIRSAKTKVCCSLVSR